MDRTEMRFVVTLQCTGSGIDQELMCNTIQQVLESQRLQQGLSRCDDIDYVSGVSVGYVTEVA